MINYEELQRYLYEMWERAHIANLRGILKPSWELAGFMSECTDFRREVAAR